MYINYAKMIVVGGISKEVNVICENYWFVRDGSFQLLLIRHSLLPKSFAEKALITL